MAEGNYSGASTPKSEDSWTEIVSPAAVKGKSLQYWCEYLENVPPFRLPLLVDDGTPTATPGTLSKQEVLVPNTAALRKLCTEEGLTMSNLIHAAWALILRAYTAEDQVCFGYSVSGRDAPVEGVLEPEMPGSLTNMLTYRVNFSDSMSLMELLREMHKDYINSLPKQYVSLAEIQHALKRPEPLFNSAVLMEDETALKMAPFKFQEHINYDMLVKVLDTDEKLSITLTHCASKISTAHAEHMNRALLAALTAFTEDPSQTAICVNLVSPETLHELEAWNAASVAAPKQTCVHNLIEQQVKEIPDHLAVNAWDRDFTYAELDQAANGYAHHLQSLGVGPDIFVMTCFEKSAWNVVAQLAIMKAGGAFCAVDPNHPIDRIRSIAEDVGSLVMLTSAVQEEKFRGLFAHLIQVDEENLRTMRPRHDAPRTAVLPNHAAYTIFTSGSTGKPKGIVIEHRSISTASTNHAQRFRLDRSSRVLQFAAYTFDAAVGDFCHTLVNGGCICVASERQRMGDLAGAVNTFRANWLFLTPTMADILDPESVPTLNGTRSRRRGSYS